MLSYYYAANGLVNNANFRVLFAFSPTGAELVYESNAGGRSVWWANGDGTNPRKLAGGDRLSGRMKAETPRSPAAHNSTVRRLAARTAADQVTTTACCSAS